MLQNSCELSPVACDTVRSVAEYPLLHGPSSPPPPPPQRKILFGTRSLWHRVRTMPAMLKPDIMARMKRKEAWHAS